MTARRMLGAVAVLFVALKLFTAEVALPDDPTSMLVLRAVPSLQSRVVGDAGHSLVLLADENGFAGDALWRRITTLGWILLPAAWVALEAGARLRARGAR